MDLFGGPVLGIDFFPTSEWYIVLSSNFFRICIHNRTAEP
jgi:hypothetical protein